jgi:hypothetical protein
MCRQPLGRASVCVCAGRGLGSNLMYTRPATRATPTRTATRIPIMMVVFEATVLLLLCFCEADATKLMRGGIESVRTHWNPRVPCVAASHSHHDPAAAPVHHPTHNVRLSEEHRGCPTYSTRSHCLCIGSIPGTGGGGQSL